MKRVTTGEVFERLRKVATDQLTGEPRERALAGFVVFRQRWQGLREAGRALGLGENPARARLANAVAPSSTLDRKKLSRSLFRRTVQLTVRVSFGVRSKPYDPTGGGDLSRNSTS
jgi:hypothetical protein